MTEPEAAGNAPSAAAPSGGVAPSMDYTPAATVSVPTLEVDVVWGDVVQVDGDVYCVGHYENVVPQNAERALDRVVSPPNAGECDLVLANLTRRGILRGSLGDVYFFPWTRAANRGEPRLVAVAGMGHPGSFGAPQLRRLARNVTWAVSALADVQTVCTVLIGAGAGNMSIAESVTGMILGMSDALGPGAPGTGVRRVRFVERELGRARAIHRQLIRLRDTPELQEKFRLVLAPTVDADAALGGTVGDEYCMALTLAAAAVSAAGSDAERRRILSSLLASVERPVTFADAAEQAFRQLVSKGHDGDAESMRPDVEEIAAKLAIEFSPHPGSESVPTRISFVRDGVTIRAAALTDTAVTPERPIGVAEDAVLGQLVTEMTNPAPPRVRELSELLSRVLVHRDFRDLVDRANSLVFDVDRAMARVHWEMLADRVDGVQASTPVALRMPVARQLRTEYSPAPGVERAGRRQLRALVIGDPGDPREGASLEFARREALEVKRLLEQQFGVAVTAFIGAPSVPREGPLQNVPPAKLLAVLNELMRGDYDILHYAGHGDFDSARPDMAGWVFQGGLLTSRHLELVDIAPSLVFANACLSALVADGRSGDTGGAGAGVFAGNGNAGGGNAGSGNMGNGNIGNGNANSLYREADLLPGLADEFFRRGVRNYVGTAWRVHDEGAIGFARAFYTALLTPDGGVDGAPPTVGSALLQARQALAQETKYGTLWAAYQHYGDPQHTVLTTQD